MESTLVGSNEGAKPPRFLVRVKSDLVLIPVKHSQVAGLAVGWLAVALSMAAIGTAAVDRVGMGNAAAQVQATVTKSATVGISAVASAPSASPSSEPPAPSAVKGDSGTRTVSLTQSARSVTTRTTAPTSASENVQVSITVPQPKITPTATPTKAKPTKVTTPKAQTGSKTVTASATANPSVVAVTCASWSNPPAGQSRWKTSSSCMKDSSAVLSPSPEKRCCTDACQRALTSSAAIACCAAVRPSGVST
jgi:hypothetical protein